MQGPISQGVSPAIVAPTYNNAGTLIQVLDRVAGQGWPMFVVNDGATDGTAELLAEWAKAQTPSRPRVVLTHERNRGKAAAMLTGFAAAAAAGFTHAITLDTDGQHDPEQAGLLVQAAREHPRALILGVRSWKIPGYPLGSRVGRRISNALVWLESGANVSDSQSGFRAYPLDLIAATPCRSGRYCFETEILTRAAWAGRPIVEVPIESRYLSRQERVSHLRPFRDTLLSIGMHLGLIREKLWK